MTKPWRKIVAVIADPFRRDSLAAKKGGALAEASSARLTLFNSFMIPQPTPYVSLTSQKQIIAAARKERLDRLEQLAAPLRKQGIEVTCRVVWDYPPHEAIIREVSKVKGDLVVADSHRHGRIARWLLTNTDWELIRHCPCPVWFARDAKWPAAPRVLTAIDPFHAREDATRMDQTLLQAADELTSHLGGTVDVIHAVVAGHARAQAQVHIDAMLQKVAVPTRKVVVSEGAPEQEIPAFALKNRIDVLVMGVLSRGSSSAAIGHTAERVIDRVECDLLVLKPAGFKTSVASAGPKL